jgi:chromosome segregation protein
MFRGGKAHMVLEKKEKPAQAIDAQEGAFTDTKDIEEKETYEGIEIDLTIPKKKIKSLEMLSGGEKTLVSLAALFALISVSFPPFLVLDEIDAALDEENARRFAELIKNFSSKTQFLIVTNNRSTMEAADALYGVTMEDDGVSRILSMKLEG